MGEHKWPKQELFYTESKFENMETVDQKHDGYKEFLVG
jgi:hypothetical protein